MRVMLRVVMVSGWAVVHQRRSEVGLSKSHVRTLIPFQSARGGIADKPEAVPGLAIESVGASDAAAD